MSSMMIARKKQIFAKLPKIYQYNSPLFAIQSVKKQDYFFKSLSRARKSLNKDFAWIYFRGDKFLEIYQKLQNLRKLIRLKLVSTKINLLQVDHFALRAFPQNVLVYWQNFITL